MLEEVFIKVKNNKHKLSLSKTNKRLFHLQLGKQIRFSYGKSRNKLKQLGFTVGAITQE